MVERALFTDEYSGLLEDYFGEEGFQELKALQREASATRSAGRGRRVLILPGILGSKIGTERTILRAIFDDVLWIDPLDIARGKLAKLTLGPSAKRHKALGVFLVAYLKLKLRLKIAGYNADSWAFDWRLSLDQLGKQLAARVKQEPGDVMLVTHSMGGLVSRAALTDPSVDKKVKRLIMLGTPNYGSFTIPQALRGVDRTVKKIAALDLWNSAEELVSQVFNTFPGLTQMMPAPEKFTAVDLYDLSKWPAEGPRPRKAILDRVNSVRDGLVVPASEGEFFLVAGVNQTTTTGMRSESGEFIYEESLEGDGTVPVAFAELPRTKTYYVEESHGSLCNNAQVGRAVIDLLNTGETRALPTSWAPSRRGVTKVRPERKFKEEKAFEGRSVESLSQREIRSLIEEVASATARDAAKPRAAGAAARLQLDNVVVGRRVQHRIDLRLAYGSITEADASAYVMGAFSGVEPSGAAKAVDDRLGGAIREFTTRRMFTGNVGEVFMLPSGRRELLADTIMFVGLGPFDEFGEEAQRLAGENIIRTLVAAKVDDFATILLGAGSGRNPASSLRNLAEGFVRGLLDADRDYRFRGITLCEMNRERYEGMKAELYRLASTSLFEDIELTFTEQTLPAARERAVAVGAAPEREDPVYLIVAQEDSSDIRASVLTSGDKAIVVTGAKTVEKKALDTHLKRIESRTFNAARLGAFGERLAQLTLHDDVAKVLDTMRDHPLVVVHDAATSRIPWETMRIDKWFPAAHKGLTRKYVADNLSIAKWLETRRSDSVLNLLLVVNPTLDLDGAKAEGKRVRELFASHPSVKIHERYGAQATKQVLFEDFRSGSYDVVHYAGHAFFDPQRPHRSGILCNGEVVLSGADLAGVSQLPALVFFNACEAGRIRSAKEPEKPHFEVSKHIERNVGLAEAFLRGGVANYVGTYWPVGDAPAKTFADTFYNRLLNGDTISQALLAGRADVLELGSVDWADYIHYGSIDFRLKEL